MIIVINGPLGIGKTETAWHVTRALPRAALVDIDYAAALQPFDHQDEADVRYACRSAAVLGEHHLRHGYEHLVLNWVFESPAQVDLIRELFGHLGEVRIYRLTCSLEELERRILRRGATDAEADRLRGRQLHAILEDAARGGDLGLPIETGGRTVREVAAAILDLAFGSGAK